MMYGIVFEQAPDGSVGAYLPDMPGVAVVGSDQADAIAMLDQAVRWHVDGMIEDGDPLPDPSDPSGYEWLIVLDRTFVDRMVPGPVSYTHLRAPRDRQKSRMPSSA